MIILGKISFVLIVADYYKVVLHIPLCVHWKCGNNMHIAAIKHRSWSRYAIGDMIASLVVALLMHARDLHRFHQNSTNSANNKDD